MNADSPWVSMSSSSGRQDNVVVTAETPEFRVQGLKLETLVPSHEGIGKECDFSELWLPPEQSSWGGCED